MINLAVFKLATLGVLFTLSEGNLKPPKVDIGHAAGFIPYCPGVEKNVTISPRTLQQLQIAIYKIVDGKLQVKSLPILSVPKAVERDKHIDLKNNKTAFYAVGFWDSAATPFSRAIGSAYAKRGYNVFVTETFSLLTYIYPKSVRLSMTIGRKLGELLVQLHELGLEPENLELSGMSLGAQVISYASKYFYQVTGKKPSLLVGLDPAGPCFRSMEPEKKFNPTDGEKVVVLHTNIDGFGTAEPLGQVDFYANGGEFQPSDIPYLPCLVICSHMRAMLYFWQAIEHPKKFIGIKCNSVQDARYADCYENQKDINYFGLHTNFNKPGIYYLATNNEFPYYRGKDGLKAENEIYSSMIRKINNDERLIV